MKSRARPASGQLAPRRTLRTTPKHLQTAAPPQLPEDDPDLARVATRLVELDPSGDRLASVLRDTIDQLLDGERTGRWDWATLHKTEKTHMGTLVEINLHREFEFTDGSEMDYEIVGVEVDCKFSQEVGGWELPPEAEGHVCLVISANDDEAVWSAGLIRVEDSYLRVGRQPGKKGKGDGKRKLTAEGESRITWLFERQQLPVNLLLTLDEESRERIFTARTGTRNSSGQARLRELFRSVTHTVIRRSVIYTVAMQDDSMRRARQCREPGQLGQDGFLVLGHQDQDPEVAVALNLPRPQKGQLVSVRVHPANPGEAPAAVIEGNRWRIARPDDPPVMAPKLSRGRRGRP